MAGVLTLSSGSITSQQGTKVIGPLQVSGAGSVAQIQDVAFASATFVSITPPTGATGCVITPPASNLIGLTLKGVTGDTGIPLQTNQASFITFAVPTSPAAFGLTSAGAISGNVELSFF